MSLKDKQPQHTPMAVEPQNNKLSFSVIIINSLHHTRLKQWAAVIVCALKGRWDRTRTSSCLDSSDKAFTLSINQSINSTSNRLFIRYPTVNRPFIHAANWPTHHWSNDWPALGQINTLLNGTIVQVGRHKGQVVFVQFISKVDGSCEALTWAHSPFCST